MLTAPVYFKFEEQGYKNLGNISDYADIYAPSVYLFKKATIAANPKLPELLIKAHAGSHSSAFYGRCKAIRAQSISGVGINKIPRIPRESVRPLRDGSILM